MESENVINNINLSINFLRNLEGLDKMNDKIFEFSQTKNFKDFLSGKLEDEEERIEIFNKVSKYLVHIDFKFIFSQTSIMFMMMVF